MRPATARRGLLTVGGCAALAALVWVGYLVYGASSSGPSGGSVVTAYLHALARGDAQAALALAATPPPDRSRLTDAVLAEQQRLGPISAVSVLGTKYGDYGAVSHVRYRVGDTAVEDRINLVRRGSGWAVQNVAVNVEVTAPQSLPDPVALGVPVPDDGEIWVFPGLVTFGSADDDFALTPGAALYTDPDVPAMVTPRAVLSPAGTSAAVTAMRAALQPCLAARSLAPSGCPQRLPAAATPGRVRGTERWQAPSGLGSLDFAVHESEPKRVQVSGKVRFPLSYRAKAGQRLVTRTVTTTASLDAALDFSSQPPTVTLR